MNTESLAEPGILEEDDAFTPVNLPLSSDGRPRILPGGRVPHPHAPMHAVATTLAFGADIFRERGEPRLESVVRKRLAEIDPEVRLEQEEAERIARADKALVERELRAAVQASRKAKRDIKNQRKVVPANTPPSELFETVINTLPHHVHNMLDTQLAAYSHKLSDLHAGGSHGPHSLRRIRGWLMRKLTTECGWSAAVLAVAFKMKNVQAVYNTTSFFGKR